MRTAPPVNVRAGGGPVWRAFGAALHAAAAAAFAAWLIGTWAAVAAGSAGAMASAATAAAIAGAFGWMAGRPRTVALGWDGERWTADGDPGTLDVMIDLDTWMLLRWRPQAHDAGAAPGAGSGARWVPVSAAEAGATWHALRVAAHAGRAAPVLPAGIPS